MREVALNKGGLGTRAASSEGRFLHRTTGSQVVSPPSLEVCKPTLDNHLKDGEGVM